MAIITFWFSKSRFSRFSTLLGIFQYDRLSSVPNHSSSRKHSNSSLFKSIFTRRASLVDSISPRLSNKLVATNPTSSIACSFVVDIPLVSTSSVTQSGLAQGFFLSARRIAYFYQSKIALLLSESLFPTNGGFSGGKPKSSLLVIFRPFASSFRIF